jgi:hypothetical protein
MMYRTAAIMREPDTTSEVFAILVCFMLGYVDGIDQPRSFAWWTDPPTEYALCNPVCPANLLSWACHSKNLNYVKVAAQNRSCPAVDAVYGTLIAAL